MAESSLVVRTEVLSARPCKLLRLTGSLSPWAGAPLRAAGGRVSWYQPIRWYTLKRFNNRTHREIIVVVRAEN